jgi:hypothetical protein
MPEAPLSEPRQSRAELDREAGRFHGVGVRLAVAAVLLVVVGAVVVVVASGVGDVLGVLLVCLGVVAGMVALALEGTALVSWWSSRDKPFA